MSSRWERVGPDALYAPFLASQEDTGFIPDGTGVAGPGECRDGHRMPFTTGSNTNRGRLRSMRFVLLLVSPC